MLLAEGHPSFVLIGSADVLSTSGRVLDEAVLVADERETVDELRSAIAGWRRRDLNSRNPILDTLPVPHSIMPRGPIFMLDTMWTGAGGPPTRSCWRAMRTSR